jgi:hypothetical protein
MTPQEAGRLGGAIGGKSRSAAKIAAARRNGFQKTEPAAPTPEPRKATLSPAELDEICEKYAPGAPAHKPPLTVVPAPSNRKPPAPSVPVIPWDELSQIEEGGE